MLLLISCFFWYGLWSVSIVGTLKATAFNFSTFYSNCLLTFSDLLCSVIVNKHNFDLVLCSFKSSHLFVATSIRMPRKHTGNIFTPFLYHTLCRYLNVNSNDMLNITFKKFVLLLMSYIIRILLLFLLLLEFFEIIK